MSSFTSVLTVSPYADGRTWYLRARLQYDVGAEGSGDSIVVPPGFTTDFASVPRVFWMLLPRWGRYGNATVVHDFLYYAQDRSRAQADRVLLEAMAVLATPAWQRGLIYAAVRVFGGLAWRLARRKRALGYSKCAARPPQRATDAPRHWRTRPADWPRLLRPGPD